MDWVGAAVMTRMSPESVPVVAVVAAVLAVVAAAVVA